MSGRVSAFDDDDGLDVSGFEPTPARRPPISPEVIREAAEARGFRSREPGPAPVTPARPAGEVRRHRTGRHQQMNLRTTKAYEDRFKDLADAQRWSLAETFEAAIDALEEKLGRRPS